MIENAASMLIPTVILLAASTMLSRKTDYFNIFGEGVRQGLQTSLGVFPALLALTVSLSMLNASGAVDWLAGVIAPAAEYLGVPAGLVPLLVTRPFSGSASTAAFSELLGKYGADSFTARCASVMMGSTDTLFYVTAMYFSATGARRTRHTLPVAASVGLFAVFFACLLCRFL